MQEKSFAFETGKASVAFILDSGLGDAIIARKVFDAIVELAPDCAIDIFCSTENHKSFARAFYGHIKNLNVISDYNLFKEKYKGSYDIALTVTGYNFIRFLGLNAEQLNKRAPKLFEAMYKVNEYNKLYIYRLYNRALCIPLIHMTAAKILNKNCYTFLSCENALPIHDNKVDIPLAPDYKTAFDDLLLDEYITIYSDFREAEKDRPIVKMWPIKYLVEYVSLIRKRFPCVEIVQCGGRGDIRIPNADRHFLGCDLELTKYILANSLLHVGSEGGLIHLATQLGTKCLTLFGPSDVAYYGYDQNINLVSEVCSPCMYLFGDSSNRNCLRGAKEPPCMLSHTPQLVCELTCNYLKHKNGGGYQ